MPPATRNDRYTGIQHHLKVHSFRAFTVLLAWGLIVAAFYQKPEILTGTQRAIQRGIETLGDNIPSPWGPRIEFVFREIGGFIWLHPASQARGGCFAEPNRLNLRRRRASTRLAVPLSRGAASDFDLQVLLSSDA